MQENIYYVCYAANSLNESTDGRSSSLSLLYCVLPLILELLFLFFLDIFC